MYDNITDQTWTDKTYNASNYIFNQNTTVVGDEETNEQQAMSQVIEARPDNKYEPTDYVDEDYVSDEYVE